MVGLRAWLRSGLLVLTLAGGLVLPAHEARASVSVAVAFEALVDRAETAMLVTPVDAHSVWENQRIVTYHRLRVDRNVAGVAEKEVWVKTLGGSVGNIGQSVSGEPVFALGESSLVFLAKRGTAYMVVERGQGQYLVSKDTTTQKLTTRRSPDVGMLLAPKKGALATQPTVSKGVVSTRYAGTLAQDVLVARALDDVAADIAEAWPKRHPAPKP
jgi:hypothetical protein